MIEQAQAQSSDKRLRTLNELVAAFDPRVEIGIRRLASVNSRVGCVVAEADAQRIRYVARLRRATGWSSKIADKTAMIEYAAFVGGRILWPKMTTRTAEENRFVPWQPHRNSYKERFLGAILEYRSPVTGGMARNRHEEGLPILGQQPSW